ncbi:MAG TPA: hypothetical protein VFT72_03765 [Opitutaceae bacterium]|nr:hypothetical protein [Opitutaceae bacterium]
MIVDPSEEDWKYLRSIFDSLLEELSRRINEEIREILSRAGVSENEKRRLVYDTVRNRDRIVAECFDDWRRSRLYERCWALKRHGLLSPQHLAKLTPQSQKAISPFDS